MHGEELLRKLSAYIAEHPPVFIPRMPIRFWMQCSGYTVKQRVLTAQRSCNTTKNLNRLLYGLPAERVNTIIDTVNDLCWEHDRQGFINGFKLEMRPEQEILQ